MQLENWIVCNLVKILTRKMKNQTINIAHKIIINGHLTTVAAARQIAIGVGLMGGESSHAC